MLHSIPRKVTCTEYRTRLSNKFQYMQEKERDGSADFPFNYALDLQKNTGNFFFFFERSLAYFTICLLPFTIIYAFEAFHFYTPQIISCCFYRIVTESALKLKSLLVFLLFSNHKRQINSFCLILILSEH